MNFLELVCSGANAEAVYTILAAILHQGNVTFEAESSGQAVVNSMEHLDRACHLLGVNSEELAKALCNPKVLVGNEWVAKGQTPTQAKLANHAALKSVYKRLFNWLVSLVNVQSSLDNSRRNSIGILDCPGFVSAEENGFESLCVNYTNELLQRAFNEQTFRLEQELYSTEQLQWDHVDFGQLDYDALDLVEKPEGIFGILEEECLFPKSSDATFKDKLFQQNWYSETPI